MPGKNFVRNSFSKFFIFLVTVLLGLAALPAYAQNVTISWDQPPTTEPVTGYQLYQDNQLLCQTSDATARQITCPIAVEGSSAFSVVALYSGGSTSSTTTTTSGTGGTTTGSTSGSTSGSTTGSTSGGTTTTSTNQTPVAANLSVSVNEDGVLDSTLNGSDPDGDALTYSIVTAPANGAVELVNPSTGEFRYTPNPNVNGGDSFTYAVSDGQATSNTATVNISILPVDDPPVANAGPDQKVNQGDTVTLNASNSYDIDSTALTYSWVQLSGPAVTISDPVAATPQFTAVDVGTTGATLSFQLTVTDDQGAASTDVCLVNIVWGDQPPVASAGPDQTVAESDTVALDGSGSTDADDGIASYSWVQVSGPATTLSDSTAMRPNFTAPQVASTGAAITYELTVTDFSGLYTKDTVIINVSLTNAPPVADAGPDQSVNAGDVVTIDGSLSHDNDDGIASVQWRQKAGVPVTLSDPTALQPTFQAPTNIQSPVTLTFELIVTDNGGLQATATCNVVVSPLQSAIAGDLNGDGVVNSQDWAIMRSALGTCSGDPGYISAADLDGDNCVTKNDASIWKIDARS